ncbi:MAG: hypothetical protein US75_C0002G0015 [Candidatus Woesebacteria bacterium GW2011_GWC1_38_13]|uniref:Methyltransferase type 11 domain-containing protein n=3 Tax=Candidatus Woeseibacteriota TaxID=1752722 RepID=A0A0G0L4Z7_9BACT|nr:MAG: hypothetical protein US67_C0016G0012 [Candidatus Woesebacteria bacterium GW2011_GWD1_38_10]KKQ56817.1 MAG: hypothetical protein US75_C0002G0015 [Candidatus Woesebacteria bacterium GW2011_GWC1_38_13]KKQ82950.1 MAG: hypothetical protein UT06_C0032G0004 [Candidatus Woesebacteria bacterium GW2011_GWA1_38_8]
MYKNQNYKARDVFYRYIIDSVNRYFYRNLKNILDVGCGDGTLSVMLREETHAEVFGCDISIRELKLAKTKGIKTKHCDLNKHFPYQTNTFDMVFSNQVIEHIIDPDHFLSECRRILKRNGRLIITTPNLTAWYNRILFIFGVYPLFLEASMRDKTVGTKFMKRFAAQQQGVGHMKVLTAEVLRDLLELNHFDIEYITALKRTLFGNLSWFPKLLFQSIDTFFSKSTELGSDVLVVAKKR